MRTVTESQARQFWETCRSYLGAKTRLEWVGELAAVEARRDPAALSMPDFYKGLLASLANRQGMPQSIGRIEDLQLVLCDFEPERVVARYGTDWPRLFRTIKSGIKPKSRMAIKVPQNYWVVFCKGALDGAGLLARFDSAEEWVKQVNAIADSEPFRAGLPKVLELEIHGIGFALACDFLKECGWSQYAKPDTHTIKILEHLELGDGKPFGTFQSLQQIARHVGETAYAVDKHVWLIGSGKLYHRDERFPTSRAEFFRHCDRHRSKVRD